MTKLSNIKTHWLFQYVDLHYWPELERDTRVTEDHKPPPNNPPNMFINPKKAHSWCGIYVSRYRRHVSRIWTAYWCMQCFKVTPKKVIYWWQHSGLNNYHIFTCDLLTSNTHNQINDHFCSSDLKYWLEYVLLSSQYISSVAEDTSNSLTISCLYLLFHQNSSKTVWKNDLIVEKNNNNNVMGKICCAGLPKCKRMMDDGEQEHENTHEMGRDRLKKSRKGVALRKNCHRWEISHRRREVQAIILSKMTWELPIFHRISLWWWAAVRVINPSHQVESGFNEGTSNIFYPMMSSAILGNYYHVNIAANSHTLRKTAQLHISC